MKQKKKIFYKIFNIILGLTIFYNFMFVAITTFTKKEYINFFEIDFLTIDNSLIIARERQSKFSTRR